MRQTASAFRSETYWWNEGVAGVSGSETDMPQKASMTVLAVEAVAQMLRCSTKTVEQRARSGDLPGLKFGDGWVFPAGALLARLDELALEQAVARRNPRSHAVTAVLHAVRKKPGKRTLPTLPDA